MMIRLLQSNNMARLAEAFIARNEAAPADPFEPVSVVVQTFGMGQWLKLRLARNAGIAANIECLLPADLVWRLYQGLLGNVPEESPFAAESLAWRLMHVLPRCDGEDFTRVRHYLGGSGDPQMRRYQLATRVAGLYDQYLMYRPEWILAWESGRDARGASWQSNLWRRLRRSPGLRDKRHRVDLHTALLQALAEPAAWPAELPKHLVVFGLSSLPPIHLETLRALSRHIDVDIYFLNPCRHYWGDIVSEKDLARRSLRALIDRDAPLTDEDYLEVGNPLLSSMGKQGREFLELLLDIDEVDIDEPFEIPDGDSMLSLVKRDILELEFGGQFGGDAPSTRLTIAAGDLSIQIHSCHSKLREVEVLHDQLLALVAQHPDITATDIIVMTPNVADYAPFIEAVFQDHLHYSIADRSANQESAVLAAFATVLALPNSRLPSTEVIDLLEVPAIARRFALHEEDLAVLTRWVQEAGIRWALNGEEKRRRWQLPESGHNTWRFGLDRLLLGYAMESRAGVWEGILPFDVDAGDAALLGTLCHFVDLLAEYRTILERPAPVHEWRERMLRLLDDFFEPIGAEELDLSLIRELMMTLEHEVAEAGFDEPLSPDLVRHWIDRQLSAPHKGRGFISGGVTFATLVPMRSVPFKVVCLLGMNDGAYPREERPLTFDLMHIEGYRRGDRSRRNDDRYLFLEALLSATECFYVSYEGRSVKDNQEKPPSVLVSEFVDYLTRIFDTNPIVVHPLQPFSDEYFDGTRPRLTTFRGEWYDARRRREQPQRFADIALEPDPDLTAGDIADLAQFLRHPARYYLQNRLRVYFNDDELDLKDTESFTLDGLERYQLADSALATLLAGGSVDSWRDIHLASGRVMDGEPGRAQLDRELARAHLAFDELDVIDGVAPESYRAEIALPGRDAPLPGHIGNIYGHYIVDVRAGTLRKRQLLDLWIVHLFANATRGGMTTLTVSTQRDKVVRTSLGPLPAIDCLQHLAALMALYDEGLAAPLPFLPETSFAYASAIARGESSTVALERALRVWQDDTPGSEGVDRNYRRLFSFPDDFDQRFCDIAQALYQPLLDCWEEDK